MSNVGQTGGFQSIKITKKEITSSDVPKPQEGIFAKKITETSTLEGEKQIKSSYTVYSLKSDLEISKWNSDLSAVTIQLQNQIKANKRESLGLNQEKKLQKHLGGGFSIKKFFQSLFSRKATQKKGVSFSKKRELMGNANKAIKDFIKEDKKGRSSTSGADWNDTKAPSRKDGPQETRTNAQIAAQNMMDDVNKAIQEFKDLKKSAGEKLTSGEQKVLDKLHQKAFNQAAEIEGTPEQKLKTDISLLEKGVGKTKSNLENIEIYRNVGIQKTKDQALESYNNIRSKRKELSKKSEYAGSNELKQLEKLEMEALTLHQEANKLKFKD